jgi:hypothetical protein
LGICSLGLLFSVLNEPLTVKKALNLVSNDELFSDFSRTFLQENKVISGTTDAKKVELVSKNKSGCRTLAL